MSHKKAKYSKKKEADYKLPRKIYEQTIDLLKNKSREYPYDLLCRNKDSKDFKFHRHAPNSSQFFIEAMKQALEDRNFRVLYEIINQALESGRPILTQQAHHVSSNICR
jgi:hypothetical protein